LIDPGAAGVVASLARPGGNVTGLTSQVPEMVGKRLQFLKEALPRLSRVSVLWNAANPANARPWREAQDAARALGVTLQSQEVYRIPSMFDGTEPVAAGGLMSYGPDQWDLRRRGAIMVDRILKGAKPVDLPIEQPTKFELVINVKTAKTLGLTIPPALLGRADQLIQ